VASTALDEEIEMSTSIRVTATDRWLACVTATAAAVLVVVPLTVPPAAAREALPAADAVTPWYAEPLGSLGGRTLAQYVADHQAHVLGPVSG
jgi:hypothetical protein